MANESSGTDGNRLRFPQDRLKFVGNLTEENRTVWPINLPGISGD
jgi:hypothetical protein